jgi:hypothetical protein
LVDCECDDAASLRITTLIDKVYDLDSCNFACSERKVEGCFSFSLGQGTNLGKCDLFLTGCNAVAGTDWDCYNSGFAAEPTAG